MDAERFDHIARLQATPSHRRAALQVALVAPLGLLGIAETEAKKKKKKCKISMGLMKCGKKCIPISACCSDSDCNLPGSGWTCGSNHVCQPPPRCGGACTGSRSGCCSPTIQNPSGFCTYPNDTCCTSEQGGGACPADAQNCCLPNDRYPEGSCASHDEICCSATRGGQVCPSDQSCCLRNADCDFPSKTCQDGCCDFAWTCETSDDCGVTEECINSICVSLCDEMECGCSCGLNDPGDDAVCINLEGDCDFPCEEGCPDGWICVNDDGCEGAHCHPPCGEAERFARAADSATTRSVGKAHHGQKARPRSSGNRGRGGRRRCSKTK